jgi:RecJ-like exonuclease
MDMNKQVLCPVCRGSGAERSEDVHTCNQCGGSGVRVVRQQIAPGFFQQMQAQLSRKCNTNLTLIFYHFLTNDYVPLFSISFIDVMLAVARVKL